MSPRRSCAIALACLAIAAGCGVPVEPVPRVVDPTLVPNQLLETTAPRPSDQAKEPTGKTTVTYFVSAGRVVPVRRPELDGTKGEKLRRAVWILLEGPTAKEQAAGIGTAIPIDLDLTVASVHDTTVTIDLAGPLRNTRSEDRTLAVAQIVLTTTSIVGVDAVRLTQKGKTLEAPLVDGSLTLVPLTATAYATLLAEATSTPTTRRPTRMR